MHQSVLDLTQDVSGCWKRWGFNLGLLPLSQRPIPMLPQAKARLPEPMVPVGAAAVAEPTAPTAPLGWRELLASATRAVPGVLLALGLVVSGADAEARDRDVPKRFQQAHPCPSTGKSSGACPGWQRDHVVPLCGGGADSVGNMQWLTVEAHKAKTRGDVQSCSRRWR